MKRFDTNILIYAHRADQRHHDFYRNRLEETLAGDEVCGRFAPHGLSWERWEEED